MRRFLLLVLLLLPSCGAGVIGGVFASNRRQGPSEVRTMTVDKPYASFYGQQNEVRRVTIAGYAAPATGRLRVVLRVLDLPDRRDPANVAPHFDVEQPNATRDEVGATFTRLLFTISTLGLPEAVVADGRSLTGADLPAQLIVRIEDADVADPIPFRIHKQPQATLVPSTPGSGMELLSAAGGTPFVCRLRGHVSQSASDLWILLATIDPADSTRIVTRDVRGVTVEPVAGTDEVIVRAIAPANTFACRVFASVQDAVAGLSTPLEELYYRPDVGFAVPSTAATDGGTRVFAGGSGLLTLRFPEPRRPGEPDYDSLSLFVQKGGRRTQIPPGLIQRRPASLARLTFELPASPDGRTGTADLVVAVDIGGKRVEALAVDLFAYGDRAPSFGPRGVGLQRRPVHVAFGDVEGDRGGLDAVACSGTLPEVQLLVSSDNGMLRRAGAPLVAGSSSELLERSPQRLIVTDLDRNGTTDALVLNLGNGDLATHTALLGQPPPAAPLGARGAVVRSATAVVAAAKGDLDGNGSEDVVVLPPASSGRPPEVYLSFGSSQEGPRLVASQLTQVTESFEVLELADLDGDGALDLALARGGQDMAVLTLYGRGDGTFVLGQALALTRQVPNYVEDLRSVAVGLHAVGDARLRGLTLLLSGAYRAATPATITTLVYLGQRQHDLPRPARTVNYDVDDAFKRSLAADLDRDAVRELVVASQKTTTQSSVHVFAWRGTTEPAFVEIPGAADLGAEPMLAIQELALGNASSVRGAGARPALFVSHEYFFSEEDRITTLLIDQQGGNPRLRAPDTTQILPHAVESLALGRFQGASGTARALDVVVASTGGGGLRGVQFFANDGIGDLRAAAQIEVSLLPATLAALPAAAGDAAVGLDRGRLLRVVRPTLVPPNDVLSFAVDPYLPAALRALEVQPESKVAVADLDSDGIADLVVLLVFPAGSVSDEERGQLLVLFGRNVAAPSELPFVVPDPAIVQAASAHGSARDLAIDDFAVNPATAKALEIAVAVGGVANHVRFYRVDRPADRPEVRGLRRSFTSAAEPFLNAGEGPERLATADIDGDGVVDLAVASAADRQLRVFTNTALAGDEVDIAAFRQIPVGALSLPEETLLQIFLRDLNGDMVPDLLVSSFDTFPLRTTVVQYHLGTGTGQFSSAFRIPSIRTGDTRWDPAARQSVLRGVPLRLALGELNDDDAVDLVSGCPTFGPDDRNLLVLFGGAR